MRWQPVIPPLLVALLGAAMALGQPAPTRLATDAGAVAVSRDAGDGAGRTMAPPSVEQRPQSADACDEALRAARFERAPEAERAWLRCRAQRAPAGRILVEDDLRTLEDVTEALHSLRRGDGAFCVAPAAPFDLSGVLAEARDSRRCFIALDRLLRSEEAILRFILEDGYAAGRLATRSRADVVALRRNPRRAEAGSGVEQEQVALARLVGRHFMRACRCLPGPQPDAMTAVRAMRLPRTVEAVMLRGIAERSEGEGP